MADGKRVAAPEKRWAEPKKKERASGAPQKGRNTGRKAGGVLLGLAAVLVIATLAFGFYVRSYDRIFPGVTAAWGSVDLSGLTREQARDTLTAELPSLLTDTKHQVELDGQVLGIYSMSDVGYAPQIDQMIDTACAAGRDGSFFANALTFANGLLGAGEDVSLSTDWDAEKTQAVMDEISALVDQSAVDASYELTRDGLFVTKQRDGRTVDQEQLRTMFASLEPGQTQTMECPVTTVSGKQLELNELAAALNTEATPARYDKESGTVKDGTVGVALDVDAARTVLDAANEGERVQLPAQITYPEMTAQELESVLFKDLLGTTTTNVGGTSVRRGNVKLAGEAVNGTVLNAGDIFDYNKVVGQRTTERGYGAAATYVNGQTVDTVGGGICQVSSTIYLASLLSNLEIVERYNHRYYPGYITLGMDATVSWGGPEFRFRNNTDYPIRIDVTYANSKLTVSFYGTKTDDTYVKMTREVLSTTGYETEYVETDELEHGVQKQKQSGYTGYKVKSYRNIYSGDGKLISSTLEATSDYKSRNEIILVGTKNRPDTQPTTPTPPEQTTPPAETPPTEGSSSDSGTTEGGTIEGNTSQLPSWLQPAE